MKVYTLHESNVGGYYRLDLQDFYNLLTSGKWGVDKETLEEFIRTEEWKNTRKHGGTLGFLRNNVCGYFNSLQEAVDSFTQITGANYCARCECCGDAFRISDYFADEVYMFDTISLQNFTQSQPLSLAP